MHRLCRYQQYPSVLNTRFLYDVIAEFRSHRTAYAAAWKPEGLPFKLLHHLSFAEKTEISAF